jgi:imidazolonepropionase-like amidohydrolase
MDKKSMRVLALVVLISSSLLAQQQPVALLGGRVIPVDGPVIEKGVVIFQNGIITSVGREDQLTIPSDAIRINVQGKTVLPGMIESNGHVTFDGQYDHGTYWPLKWDQLYQIGERNLMADLQQGITTLRDTFGPIDVMLQLKKSVAQGDVAGSRLYTCGLILNYGSFTELLGSKELLASGIDPKLIKRASDGLNLPVADAEEGKKIIREYARRGVDFIKISAFSAEGEIPPTMPFSTLKALVEEAHRLGLRTTTHAMSASSVQASIDAGSDAIEHPEFISGTVSGKDTVITPALAQKMAQRKVYAIPLKVAYEVYTRYCSDPGRLLTDRNHQPVPKELLDEGKRNLERALSANPKLAQRFLKHDALFNSNLKTLIDANVPIAMGTDRGTRLNYHQAANHIRELAIYVELGMSNLEAIRSATLRGAELLGVDNKLGSLTQGKLADIIVVEGNPLQTIESLGDVAMVFKEGKRYR